MSKMSEIDLYLRNRFGDDYQKRYIFICNTCQRWVTPIEHNAAECRICGRVSFTAITKISLLKNLKNFTPRNGEVSCGNSRRIAIMWFADEMKLGTLFGKAEKSYAKMYLAKQDVIDINRLLPSFINYVETGAPVISSDV